MELSKDRLYLLDALKFLAAILFIGLGVRSYEIDFPFFNGQAARGYSAFFWGIILHYIICSGSSKTKLKGGSIAISVSHRVTAYIQAERFVSS